MFSFWVMVIKLSKKVHFLQYCPNLSEKSKSVKAIYIYASCYASKVLLQTSENGTVNYAMTYCFKNMSVWSWTIL